MLPPAPTTGEPMRKRTIELPILLTEDLNLDMVSRFGGTGPFSFRLTVPENLFHTAHLKLNRIALPVDGGYAIDVYVHPAKQEFQPNNAKFSEQYRYPTGFYLWGGHSSHTNPDLVENRDPHLRITPLLEKLSRQHAGESWIVYPRSQQHVSKRRRSRFNMKEFVQFRNLELVLDRSADTAPASKQHVEK